MSRYDSGMGKLGGLLAIATAALVLSGCGGVGETAAVETSAAAGGVQTQELEVTVSDLGSRKPRTAAEAASIQRNAFDVSKFDAYTEALKASGARYGTYPRADLMENTIHLCAHYADGFTTEDLETAAGHETAIAGEIARGTVCK